MTISVSDIVLAAAWDATEGEHNAALAVQKLSPEYSVRIHMVHEPHTALSAPLTELVFWDLKEGAEPAKVEELLTKLSAAVNAIPRAEGLHRAGWGSVVGDKRKYAVINGWDSVDVRFSAVLRGEQETDRAQAWRAGPKKLKEGRAFMKQLMDHTTMQVQVVHLQQHKLPVGARL